ncbi:solute carrier family 49 member 4 isoform X2 [Nematostella vectensis]|uniref:solute carrier family 49 member 4 isoform X2 n=1 Tax=Nematostella vectensis TaxID=45351 RepID=UPI0020772326|nr:solute carrier family 49 member 4 isoform X2 [Nematostella vectensis]
MAMNLEDQKGLRVTVITAVMLLFIGKGTQVLAMLYLSNVTQTWLINLGQLVSMLPSAALNGGAPFVSAVWFPSNERATATALGVVATSLGIALSFVIGPQMVPDECLVHNKSQKTNQTLPSQELSLHMILHYMYLQLGMVILLLFCVIVYFPNKPKLPPSHSKAQKSIGGVKGLQMLCLKKSFWLLNVFSAVGLGVQIGWLSTLSAAVEPFGVSQRTAGWLGCVGSLSSMVSGVLTGRIADTMMYRFEHLLLVLMLGGGIFQLLFSLTCQNIIPYNEYLLYASVIGQGFILSPESSLLFELLMEATFPIHEAIVSGIYMATGNIVILLFYIPFLVGHVPTWVMNWVYLASLGVGIPFYAIFRVKYVRIGIDDSLVHSTVINS